MTMINDFLLIIKDFQGGLYLLDNGGRQRILMHFEFVEDLLLHSYRRVVTNKKMLWEETNMLVMRAKSKKPFNLILKEVELMKHLTLLEDK